MEWFEWNGGVDGNRWSDEDENDDDYENDKNTKKKHHQRRDNDDDEDDTDNDDGEFDQYGARRRGRGGMRPRSAAERLLIRPGRQTSSFTQRMLRFAESSNKEIKKV